MVEDALIELSDLKQATIEFIENGGVLLGAEGHCDYCQGKRDVDSSDNPDKAIVLLNSHRLTEYGVWRFKMNLLRHIMY